MSGALEPTPSNGLQLLAALEAAGAIDETSLRLPPDTPYDQCEALAKMFGELHKRCAWYIGDLLNHMEKVFGETYAQAADATGLNVTTLYNYTSVCAHIPRSRRRSKVRFSTHSEVAYLEPDEQTRWLKEAEKHNYTKQELRDARAKEDKKLTPAVEVVCHCPTCGNQHNPKEAVSGNSHG